MNETELDEMLNQWDAPEVPRRLLAELHEMQRKQKSGWTMRWLAWLVPGGKLFAGAAVGSVVCLLLMIRIQAAPQAPGIHVPWTVDSELIKYADDGTSSVEMQMTSYKLDARNEVLLSRSVPGNVFMTAFGRTLDVVGPALSRLTLPFVVDANTLERVRKMRREHPGIGLISGCTGEADSDCLTLGHYGLEAGNSCIAGKIVDHATILNHATEAVRERWMEHGRMTIWSAPDLQCFALKVTYESQQADGSFHLVRAKQAVKVTVNP